MAAILADAPEAYWRLDDTDSTLRDMMGRHHGTYTRRSCKGTTPGALTGDSNPCATFGGSANFASVPASTNFNGTYVSGDFSMECLVFAACGHHPSVAQEPLFHSRRRRLCQFLCGDAGHQVQC